MRLQKQGKGRGATDLDEPRLERVVDHDVITIELETVLIVDHHVLQVGWWDKWDGSGDGWDRSGDGWDGWSEMVYLHAEEAAEDEHLHAPEELVDHLTPKLRDLRVW